MIEGVMYRASVEHVDDGPEIEITESSIISETPDGYWIKRPDLVKGRSWTNRGARGFAQASELLAENALRHRTLARLHRAQIGLWLAQASAEFQGIKWTHPEPFKNHEYAEDDEPLTFS